MEQFLNTFFSWEDFTQSFPQVLKGFTTNLSLMFVAEFFVLLWGLALALLRSGRSRALRPVRWLTVGYIDLFRAIPGLVLIYMIGFGIPIAGVPWIGHWSQYQLAALALTLLYGAYVRRCIGRGSRASTGARPPLPARSGCPTAGRCASWCCRRRSAA